MSDITLRMYFWAQNTLASLKSEERGQDLIEYALWGGIIAAAIVTIAVTLLNTGVTDLATNLAGCIDFDGTADCTFTN